MKRSEAMASK